MIEENIFFVVGASKSGTTSINEYLEAHPDVNMVKYKDVACYFCRDYGLPITLDEYKAMLFPQRPYIATGDCCHAYLTDEHSASWIHSEFPNAKIIIILRNPADRAFSQYHWLVAHGYEYAATFEEALRLENNRFLRNVRKQYDLIQGYKDNYLYYRTGLYSQQVKRYLDLFPKEKVHFIKFDDLKSDGESIVRNLYSFVGVNADQIPTLEIHNERAEPRNIKLQYFMVRHFRKIFHWRLIDMFVRWNLKSKPTVKFNPDTRRELLSKYSFDIRATEKLTGLDLSDWLD